MMKLKDMRQGTFRGMTALDKKVKRFESMHSWPQIHDFAKRNKLDAQAAVKLAEAAACKGISRWLRCSRTGPTSTTTWQSSPSGLKSWI